MKTNAEILKGLGLNEKSKLVNEAMKQARAEERKKVMPLTEKATLVSESYAKGYENGKKSMKGLYAETTPEKPKITREQVEELAYCLHELRRSWNGNSHGKIKWDNSVKDRYEILAKECIEAMGLEVEEK